MAKLGAYYGLCPLIDQKNLLGVSEDKEPGHVIVTLGKNIGIAYRLADQKQIHSWRTKEKFTSPILYDKPNNRYVAVFNQVYIRTWTGSEEYVDKLKKFKFKKPIYTILTCNNAYFIVFRNGFVAELNHCIEQRKQLDVEDVFDPHTNAIESILSVAVDNVAYIGLLVNVGTARVFRWNAFPMEGLNSCGQVDLRRENCELRGQVLMQLNDEDCPHLLTLWSDGQMFAARLGADVEFAPFAHVDTISPRHTATMVALDRHYLAIYGAQPNEEGAMLALYNTQFRVMQSHQPLKLFASGAAMWSIDRRLLLPIGQNLGVVPYHLVTEQLAALVGTSRHNLSVDNEVMIVDRVECGTWSTGKSTPKGKLASAAPPPKHLPAPIRDRIHELTQQGVSEALICNDIIPMLLLDNNVTALCRVLDYFRDIPEVHLANMLKYALNAHARHFPQRHKIPIEFERVPDKLEPPLRCHIIGKIIAKPCTDTLILPHLRATFDLDTIFLLMLYLIEVQSQQLLVSADSERMWIEWGSLLLDAGYQKFLLTRDEQVLAILKQMNELVVRKSGEMKQMQLLEPVIMQLVEKRNSAMKMRSILNSYKYSIEKIKLY